MVTLFRSPRRSDTSLGAYMGEQLRVVVPTDGPLAGMTTVRVSEQAAQLMLADGAGGWERDLSVGAVVAMLDVNDDLSVFAKGSVILGMDLAALEYFLDVTVSGLLRETVHDLRAVECLKDRPRKGALALFDAWLAAHPSDPYVTADGGPAPEGIDHVVVDPATLGPTSKVTPRR